MGERVSRLSGSSYTGWSCLPAISKDPKRQRLLNEFVNFPVSLERHQSELPKGYRHAEVVVVAKEVLKQERKQVRKEVWHKRANALGSVVMKWLGHGSQYDVPRYDEAENTDSVPPANRPAQGDEEPVPQFPPAEQIGNPWEVRSPQAWHWELLQRVAEQGGVAAQPPDQTNLV